MHRRESKTKVSFGPSDSPSLTAPGECLYGDIKALTEVSVAGKSTAVRFTDGYSGYNSETLCSSKSAKDLFLSIMAMIHTIYNANGITVRHVVVDSDPAFKPVIALLGAHGILMTLVGPGQFCQRMERSIQDQDNRGAAILASLPYVLPPKYHSYLRQYIIDCLNSMSNAKTFPTSPQRLIHGRDIPATPFGFGDTVMVRQFAQKRTALAKAQGTIPGTLPRAELGVMMGFAANLPGSLLFLLANGEIVPRSGIARVEALSVINGRSFLPKSVIRAHLSLPVIDDSVQFGSFPSVPLQESLQGAISFPVEPTVSFGSFPSVPIGTGVFSPPVVRIPVESVHSPIRLSSSVQSSFPVSPVQSSPSTPANHSPYVPMRLAMSPEGVVPIPTPIVPSVVSRPNLRRSSRNLSVPVVGLISLESESSTCIVRSINPDGTVHLSPFASPFVPRIAALSHFAKSKTGEIISLVSILSHPPVPSRSEVSLMRVPVVSSAPKSSLCRRAKRSQVMDSDGYIIVCRGVPSNFDQSSSVVFDQSISPVPSRSEVSPMRVPVVSSAPKSSLATSQL